MSDEKKTPEVNMGVGLGVASIDRVAAIQIHVGQENRVMPLPYAKMLFHHLGYLLTECGVNLGEDDGDGVEGLH